MRIVQEAVVSNKDLDLPTQQELLAQFRCDEIANNSFGLFEEAIKQFPVNQGTGKIIDGLGGMMKQVIELAICRLPLHSTAFPPHELTQRTPMQRAMIPLPLDTTLLSTLANVPSSSRNSTRPFIPSSSPN
jgi:hypothetical protein